MSTIRQKLTYDLRVLEAMAGLIATYLASDTLFWLAIPADLSMITLGEYLMRQNRLLVLRNKLLKPEDQERLDGVSSYFDRVLYHKVDIFEQVAQQELQTRLQQWADYLQKIKRGQTLEATYCYLALKTRVIAEEIVQKLYLLSCQPPADLAEQLDQLDVVLSEMWQPGKFIWPAEWQPAYPQAIYWWLYGKPELAGCVSKNVSTYLKRLALMELKEYRRLTQPGSLIFP